MRSEREKHDDDNATVEECKVFVTSSSPLMFHANGSSFVVRLRITSADPIVAKRFGLWCFFMQLCFLHFGEVQTGPVVEWVLFSLS